MEPKKLAWVKKSQGVHEHFAVVAGVDLGGKKQYVARAHHEGGIVPGKLCAGWSSIAIPYGCKEVWKSDFEILTAPPGTLSWVECIDRKIPANAIQGGNDPNGSKDPYYIGRVIHQGSVTVGKVYRGTCLIPFGGKEHGYSNYEILVRNNLGTFLKI